MDALQHLALLLRYDRTFNLRKAVAEASTDKRVLDAGCGAGILSLWAAAAGAREVVGVDLEALELARALAEENQLASTIRFLEGDLRELTIDSRRNDFDAIVAMVYLNDPRRDESQSELVYSLRDKYLKRGGVMIPDRVRYRAAACEWPEQDHQTRLHRVGAYIEDLEGRYGLSFSSMRKAVASRSWKPWFPPRLPDGRLEFQGGRMLSPAGLFVQIDYLADPVTYPPAVDFEIAAPGLFNAVIWTQELWYRDLLLFSNESVSWVEQPRRVNLGDRLAAAVDAKWRGLNVLNLSILKEA